MEDVIKIRLITVIVISVLLIDQLIYFQTHYCFNYMIYFNKLVKISIQHINRIVVLIVLS